MFKKMRVAKGKYGVLIEQRVLKNRYNKRNHKAKNHKYDLPLELNALTHKNVSIKSSRANTICCGGIFNFLSSTDLELIVVQYFLSVAKHIKVKFYYSFNNLDDFFINLNSSLDLVKLQELNYYIKGLKYPFSKKDKDYCHNMGRLVIKKDFCGFKVKCKFSSENKRIQCSLKLNRLVSMINPECLFNDLETNV